MILSFIYKKGQNVKKQIKSPINKGLIKALSFFVVFLVVGCESVPTTATSYKAPLEEESVRQEIVNSPKVLRIERRVLNELIDSCVKEALFCAMTQPSNHRLSALGAKTLHLLKESEAIGIEPELYAVPQIENLLNDPSASIYKVDAYLLAGLLTYIRDVVEGRPELRALDREWLLQGEKAQPVATALAFIRSEGDLSLLEALEPRYSEYQNLKKGLHHYQQIVKERGEETITRLSENQVLRKGDQSVTVTKLRMRLVELGYLPPSHDLTSTHYDNALFEVVKAFQKEHQLDSDGVIGAQTFRELNLSLQDRIEAIKINLERWRWMPKTMGNHYIMVDIPGYEYSVVKEGEVKITAKTIVGKDLRPTPVFSANMNHIVFSPYWHVPRSIAVKDQLPRLVNNPERLVNSRIRIFDQEGSEVDPLSVDWSEYSQSNFPYTLRQDPGAYNALGQVKFMFPNRHAIYLHDTPEKYLFDREARNFSSGCVRIQNPTELALYFLREQGWTEERVRKAYSRGRELTVRLEADKKIPVYTLYMTTKALADGTVLFRSDIYKRDRVLIEASKNLVKKVS